MRCEKDFGPLCPGCHRKWVVQPDRTDGTPEAFCFDTEAEARACFEQIERTNEYMGLRFRPNTAVLFAPRGDEQDE